VPAERACRRERCNGLLLAVGCRSGIGRRSSLPRIDWTLLLLPHLSEPLQPVVSSALLDLDRVGDSKTHTTVNPSSGALRSRKPYPNLPGYVSWAGREPGDDFFLCRPQIPIKACYNIGPLFSTIFLKYTVQCRRSQHARILTFYDVRKPNPYEHL
jgi:hypothetical protein